jgi:hypothetical protein
MRRDRDHKAEYRRRLERGRERGLTRSQARGHARAQEASLKTKPVKSDERLEKALRELRRTNNQAVAAKEVGVSDRRRLRGCGRKKLRKGGVKLLKSLARVNLCAGSGRSRRGSLRGNSQAALFLRLMMRRTRDCMVGRFPPAHPEQSNPSLCLDPTGGI